MGMFEAGDAGAFEKLFSRYKAPIFSFLLRQCGSRDTAGDLMQDVFMRVIKGAAAFERKSKFSTWIYAIARNLAVDTARKARHRAHPSLDQETREDGPTLGERQAGKGPAPDRSATASRMREHLVAAIERLPEEQREVFLLREYHGLSFQEIAEVVEAKVGTVKSRMRYALEAMRIELAEYADYARTLS